MAQRMTGSDPEAELVRRAQNQDVAAFTALVHSHYGVALGYAYSLLRDVHHAEDATQEAFAEAHTFLPRLQDPAAFAGWLRSIVRHRCLRRIRQRDWLSIAEPSALESLHAAPVGRTQESTERSDLLRRALSTLPKSERDVVTLFYLNDCSQREIAAFLQLPVTTVNNRLHKARQRLKQWGANMHDTTIHQVNPDHDPALKVGTILRVQGPVVEVRFDPTATLDIFDALALIGSDGLPVERLKVSHRIGDGRALCLMTNRGADRLVPGTTLLNAGPGIILNPRFAFPAVGADEVVEAVEVLAPKSTAKQSIFETGIKAIDLLCPVAAGGSVAQVGVTGVGRIALLEELRHALKTAEVPLHLFGLVEKNDSGNYRDWPAEAARQDRAGQLYTYWVVAHHGTDPDFLGLRAFDAVHYCTPILAVQGLYPAIDPEYSSSALLSETVAGADHVELARRARTLLIEAKRTFCPGLALELWACSARGSAARSARDFQPEIAEADELRLSRARKLQFFLTQPFWTAAQDTGWRGCSVSLRDTLDGCRKILDGEVDDLPVDAFRYVGTLDEARELAKSGEFRCFG
jgi:RNA polymerase sigma factor (sigma-70 family)